MAQYSTTYGRKTATISKYENINVKATGGNRKSHLLKGEKGKYNVKNKIQQSRNAVKKVGELIENNFDKTNSFFVTLTFCDESYACLLGRAKSDSLADIYKESNKEVRKFIKRVKNKYDGVHYVAIPELQENRNAIHYHMIWNVIDLSKDEIMKLWKHGSADSKKVYDEEKLSDYVNKDKRKSDRKNYFKPEYIASQGLCKSAKVKSWAEWDASYDIACEIKANGELVEKYSYQAGDGSGEIKSQIYKNIKPLYEVQPVAKRKQK